MTAREILPESDTICEFMTENYQAHLLSYLLKFGPKNRYEKCSELERIELTQVDRDGFELSLMMCSESTTSCVCVHERLEWMNGLKCESGGQCVERFSEMSQACGLKGEI